MSPVNVSAIGSYIREQREQAKISLRQLAQSAGISNPYLSQIERGLRRPSADILQQIAKGLRISAEALFVQAGLLEDRPPGSEVRDAVLSDLELTERQKQMLIEIYESFRKETAIARVADAAELQDDQLQDDQLQDNQLQDHHQLQDHQLQHDQTGLPPDEAALNWPEDIGPAALAGGQRRLAIATPYQGADEGDEDDEDDEEESDSDEPGEVFQLGRGQDNDEPGQGGTIHQFPPPTGNR